MLLHLAGRLLAAPSTQTTVNPNTFDAWLGRLLQIMSLLAVVGGGALTFRKKINRRVTGWVEALIEKLVRTHTDTVVAAVENKTDAVAQELRAHTDAEAGIVRRELDQALTPVTQSIGTLSTQVGTIATGLQTLTTERVRLLGELREADAELRADVDALIIRTDKETP